VRARIRSAWAAFAALLVIGSPEIARACSVCMSGTEDENRLAFILTTVFMTFLPLGMIGGMVWYLRRRHLALAAARQAAYLADLSGRTRPIAD
jgi:hypothetical protein